ncbi:MAG TPA: SDR family NAD(P)-dependent oxidoreductase [Acidocella sp.]|nr:SDR family NAD(P)-dependent oxidoreductase [Acidocella sp.]
MTASSVPAGIAIPGAAHEITRATWEKMLAVHVTGTFLMCKYAVPGMMKRRVGSIVVLSSIYGKTGCMGNLPYNPPSCSF